MDKHPSLCAKASRQSGSESVQLGFVDRRKMFFFVYGLKTRIRKGDEVLYIPLRLRFASLAKLWISMYHQAQSWKETRSTTIAFKSEVTKAKEVSVRSRML